MGVMRAAPLITCAHAFFFINVINKRLTRTMNRYLFATTVALSVCSVAHASEATEMAALKSECAAKYETASDLKTAASNEFHFVYAKGEYKGEAQAGKVLPCTEKQLVAYMETADPARVMAANPTAAGHAAAKKADKK